MHRLGALLVILGLVVACGGGGRTARSSCFQLGVETAPRKPGGGVQVELRVRFLLVEDTFLQDLGVDLPLDLAPTPDATPTFGGVLQEDHVVGVDGVHLGGAPGQRIVVAEGAHAGALLPVLHDTAAPGLDTAGAFVQMPGDDNQCFTMADAVEEGFSGTSSNLAPLPTAPEGTFTQHLAGAFLDTAAVNAVLAAIASDNSRLVLAPSVPRVFDAQRVVFFARQSADTTGGLNPLGQAALANLPAVPMQVTTGTTLEVVPRIRGDGQSIDLEIRPGSTALGVVYPLPITVGGTTGQVELPVFQTCTVRTMVTIPDGGTLLLGGLRDPGNAAGPVLPNLPYVNRLFQAASPASTNRGLMLMITPRIIILQEQEQQ